MREPINRRTGGGPNGSRRPRGSVRHRAGFLRLEPLGAREVPAVLSVTTTADSGPGSLRQALLDSNASAGVADEVRFALPGAGVQTITVASALPVVTDPVTIDGLSQPGSTAQQPLVELSGANAGPGAVGLWVTAGKTAVGGLVVNGFDSHGIYFRGGREPADGQFRRHRRGRDRGQAQQGGRRLPDQLGRQRDRRAGAGNLISGNGDTTAEDGVEIQGAGATGNVVQANRLGTNAAGTAAVPNAGSGVQIFQASGNLIGGTAPGAGNLVSGNADDGIGLNLASGNQIVGNLVGTDATGTAAVPNGRIGVYLFDPSNDTVGGPGTAGNVVSGNGYIGVALFGLNAPASGNLIAGNRIGTNAAGTAALPNTAEGVAFFAGASGNALGRAGDAFNVISGNGYDGVAFNRAGPNAVNGDRVGTNAAGTAAVPNARHGVFLFRTPGVTIENNVLSGNAGNGVLVNGAESAGTVVRSNTVGTSPDRLAAVGNKGGGVVVQSADGVAVGSLGAGNFVAADGLDGVAVSKSNGVLIQGNTIGAAGLGNGQHGVFLANKSSGAVVGGAGPNTITANGGVGVLVGSDPARGGIWAVPAGSKNAVTGNSISGNGSLGIDVGPKDGATPNDPLDADAGPNDGLNAPALSEAAAEAGEVAVAGTYAGLPGVPLTLHFYAGPADPGGAEGKRFLGTASVTTDATGRPPTPSPPPRRSPTGRS